MTIGNSARIFTIFTVVAMLVIAPMAVITSPVHAQEAKEDIQICIATKKAELSDDNRISTIMVMESNQATMQARGFRKTPCKSTKQKRSDYQREICKFAKIAPAKVQVEFSRDHGATPAELCAVTK